MSFQVVHDHVYDLFPQSIVSDEGFACYLQVIDFFATKIDTCMLNYIKTQSKLTVMFHATTCTHFKDNLNETSVFTAP